VDVTFEHRDRLSWTAPPPRYSVVRPLAPLPALQRTPPSQFRERAAKLLLSTVLSTVVAVLAFALLSAAARGLPSLPLPR